jgi:hypothetical protein
MGLDLLLLCNRKLQYDEFEIPMNLSPAIGKESKSCCEKHGREVALYRDMHLARRQQQNRDDLTLGSLLCLARIRAIMMNTYDFE